MWCSDRDCPAEQGYPVFDYGDYVADLKIVRMIAVWRTAVLYEAMRNDKPVWLKVAHRDDECEGRLKRDAKWLQLLAPREPTSHALEFPIGTPLAEIEARVREAVGVKLPGSIEPAKETQAG